MRSIVEKTRQVELGLTHGTEKEPQGALNDRPSKSTAWIINQSAPRDTPAIPRLGLRFATREMKTSSPLPNLELAIYSR